MLGQFRFRRKAGIAFVAWVRINVLNPLVEIQGSQGFVQFPTNFTQETFCQTLSLVISKAFLRLELSLADLALWSRDLFPLTRSQVSGLAVQTSERFLALCAFYFFGFWSLAGLFMSI